MFQYYLVIGITFFLLMCGLNFGFLYRQESRAVERKLRIIGIREWQVSATKILIMGSVLWGSATLIYSMGCGVSHLFASNFLMFDVVTLFYFVPVMFCIAGYFHVIYGVSKSSVQGGMLLFITNTIMVIGAGGIVPAVYLPEMVRKVGNYFPLTLWNGYLVDAIFAQPSMLMMVLVSMLGFIFAVMGAIMLWKNT